MSSMTLGVVGSSFKENELRVPIHPEQLDWIDPGVRKKLFFEVGYGDRFQISDDWIKERTGGLMQRNELFEECDVIILIKPDPKDIPFIHPEKTLWGWLHCVEDNWITNVAIQKNLTMVAFEAMHKWNRKSEFQYHIFHKNNEIAGYAGVFHALQLRGIDGHYGTPRRIMIIGSGSVSRGALQAFKGLGFKDIHIYNRPSRTFIAPQSYDTTYHQLEINENGELLAIHADRSRNPFIEEIAKSDVILNGILQDFNNPIMFMRNDEIDQLKRSALIIDIARDEALGFPFSKPTTFENPIFTVGEAWYYAVDHTSSYLWNIASWEISISLLPFLSSMSRGAPNWENDETIHKAIQIQNGRIIEPKILSFQNREAEYPYLVKPR